MRRIFFKITSLPESAKSAIVYTAATLFSRGLAIITVPIFTRLMSTDQIGVVNLYNSWYALISAIATLSLTSGGYMVAMKEYPDKTDQYQSSVLTLTSIIAAVIAAVYFAFPKTWNAFIGLPSGLIILMLIGFFFAPARDFWFLRQRYAYQYKLAGLVSVGSALAASALSVVAVLYISRNGTGSTAEGRLFANYFVLYGVSAVIWIATMVKGKTFYNREFWTLSLSLSLPLVGYSLAAQVLNVSDRMMIGRMVSNSAVGIYSTLYTVSSLSLMIWQAIHSSFVPYLFQNLEDKTRGPKKVATQLMLVYAGAAVLLTYLAPEIVRILATDAYYEAIYIMPPIAAGVFFTAFANLYSDIAVYYKKTKYVMYPAVIAAFANVGLNYIFIHAYGYMAAAYTTLFSYILMALFQGIWVRKLCKENNMEGSSVFEDRKMIFIAGVTTILCLLGIVLYRFYIVRYFLVGLMAVKGVILFREYKAMK